MKHGRVQVGRTKNQRVAQVKNTTISITYQRPPRSLKGAKPTALIEVVGRRR